MESRHTRLVVVEDDEIILEFLEMVFATESIEVIRARDGASALEMVERYVPDALVCDLHLRDSNGLDVISQIRQDHALAHIPVLVLTADDKPSARRRSLAAGADAFVLKPFDPDELIEIVSRLTERRRPQHEVA